MERVQDILPDGGFVAIYNGIYKVQHHLSQIQVNKYIFRCSPTQ